MRRKKERKQQKRKKGGEKKKEEEEERKGGKKHNKNGELSVVGCSLSAKMYRAHEMILSWRAASY